MLDSISKAFFYRAAESKTLQQIASRYGLKSPNGFARRFIAGETVEEAIEAAQAIEADGMMTTLDYLGEGVSSVAGARAATEGYLAVMAKAVAAGISRNLSIKLTQLGLSIDRDTCLGNLHRILDAAQESKSFVRIDMEGSAYTEATLDVFATLWEQGYRNVGVVVQSYLYRSEADVDRINRLGARVRLVKGAYHEPKSVAYARKADVDAAFVRLMEVLLTEGTYPAIATHDPGMIEATRRFAERRHISRQQFEFQMLYGIRRDLQASLTAEGYPFRVYLPFGRDWFHYFMRRLGERPANVGFIVRSLAWS